MGNNCLKPRAVTWMDDEEEEFEQEVVQINEEKRKFNEVSSSSSSIVKIKITKRQLEEILRLSSKKKLPMELVLSSFINSNNTVLVSDQTSKWRPRLQTIAEQDEMNILNR